MFTRICQICNREVSYKRKAARDQAVKLGSKCKKCSNAANSKICIEKRKSGEIPWSRQGQITSEETKKLLSAASIANNAMKRGGLYPLMIAKYGEEIGRQKIEEQKKNMSLAMSGDKNPMFGKPTPNGSGYGWQGWYKGWRFRSLLELSFVINVLERFKFQWKSAEISDLRILYSDYEGNDRTYVADFLVAERWLVEVKPTWMKNTVAAKLKASAAIEFCKNRNLKFKFFDPGKFSDDQIKKLHDEGTIKFDKRYEELYTAKYPA